MHIVERTTKDILILEFLCSTDILLIFKSVKKCNVCKEINKVEWLRNSFLCIFMELGVSWEAMSERLKNIPESYESESLLPCSQQSATGPYPKRD
jgi:hypothetical protein